MTRGHIAVIDIGKTNAKLALVAQTDLSEVAVLTHPNTVLAGPPWPHFDVEAIWAFLLDGLTRFQAEFGISALSITTHGACAALLDAQGQLAAPILDYEHPGPEDLHAEYAALRPDFGETGSPHLSLGLNVGAQLYWQFATDPGLWARTRHIVTYPQFWGHRLSGQVATDVTSLGAHTDLWNPHLRQFSSLVDRLDLADKIAPPVAPGTVLGPVLPQIAARTGLDPDTPVLCGIHDSNASLLPHIRTNTPPFSVVSTGTWVIAMTLGGAQKALNPDQDVLINVNAYGQPVPSARFMGGREHDLAMAGPYPTPDSADLNAVLQEQSLLLPALCPECGPFRGAAARWSGPEPAAGSARRGAAVALYLALVTATCLDNTGHRGPILVEGPFAANLIYLQMLSTLMDTPVVPSQGSTGTSQGAALLADIETVLPESPPRPVQTDPEIRRLMLAYAQHWTDQTRSLRI